MSSKQKKLFSIQIKNYFQFKLNHIVQRIENNISLDLISQEFKSYEVTMDNINSFKKKEKQDKPPEISSKQSKSSKSVHYSKIDRQLVVFVCKRFHRMRKPLTQYDWSENSLQ